MVECKRHSKVDCSTGKSTKDAASKWTAGHTMKDNTVDVAVAGDICSSVSQGTLIQGGVRTPATVDLPTPPLPEATAMTCCTPASPSRLGCAAAGPPAAADVVAVAVNCRAVLARLLRRLAAALRVTIAQCRLLVGL